MNDDEQRIRSNIGWLNRRVRMVRKAHARLHKAGQASLRRPGRGSGASSKDLWSPCRQYDAYVPDDERCGKTLCSACGEPVRHVEIDGKWYVRNKDDELPHMLSCEPGGGHDSS